MKIARYWTRADAEALTPGGQRIRTRARGWSDEGLESARACARDLARRVAERLASGAANAPRYPYGDRPLPEPVVREFSGGAALVTRNAYGALVLNTGRLLFADIDAQPPHAGLARSFAGAFAALFGKKDPSSPASDPAVERIRAITRSHRRKARLYRTAAGFRLMITDAPYRPGSPETEALLAEYHTDPLYVRLCRMQESFRARLTPKPWRCGMPVPPVEFPYETDEARNRYARWESQYHAKTAAFATCRFVAELGSGYAQDEFQEVIEFHDRETKAAEPLPLA